MSDAELDDDIDDFPLGDAGMFSPAAGTPTMGRAAAAASPSDGAAAGSGGKAAERQRLLDMGVQIGLPEVEDEMKAMLDLATTSSGRKQLLMPCMNSFAALRRAI